MKNKLAIISILIIVFLLFSAILFTSCKVCCNGNPGGKHYNARNLTNK